MNASETRPQRGPLLLYRARAYVFKIAFAFAVLYVLYHHLAMLYQHMLATER